MTDGKLEVWERIAIIQDLQNRLSSILEKTARALTDEEIQDSWLFVCEQLGIKPKIGTAEPEPLYQIIEDDIYEVARDMGLKEDSITPEVINAIKEAYRDFDFEEHHQFIEEKLESLGLERKDDS